MILEHCLVEPASFRWAIWGRRILSALLLLLVALPFVSGTVGAATTTSDATRIPNEHQISDWCQQPGRIDYCVFDQRQPDTRYPTASANRFLWVLRDEHTWFGPGDPPRPEDIPWDEIEVASDDMANAVQAREPEGCGGYINLNPFRLNFDIGGWIQCTAIEALNGVAGLFEAAVNNPLTQIDGNEWRIVLGQAARWGGVLSIVALGLCAIEILAGAFQRNGARVLQGFLWAVAAWPLTVASLIIFGRLIWVGDWLSSQILHWTFAGVGGDDALGAITAVGAGGLAAGGLMATKMAAAAAALSLPAGWVIVVALVAGAFLLLLALIGILALVTYAQMLLAAFAPIALMLAGFRGTRSMSIRWAEMAVTLLLVKPVIASIISLNLLLMTDGEAGFNTIVTGIIGMLLTLAAPMVVFQIVGFAFATLGPALGGAVAAAKGALSGAGKAAEGVKDQYDKGKAEDKSFANSASAAAAGGKSDANGGAAGFGGAAPPGSGPGGAGGGTVGATAAVDGDDAPTVSGGSADGAGGADSAPTSDGGNPSLADVQGADQQLEGNPSTGFGSEGGPRSAEPYSSLGDPATDDVSTTQPIPVSPAGSLGDVGGAATDDGGNPQLSGDGGADQQFDGNPSSVDPPGGGIGDVVATHVGDGDTQRIPAVEPVASSAAGSTTASPGQAGAAGGAPRSGDRPSSSTSNGDSRTSTAADRSSSPSDTKDRPPSGYRLGQPREKRPEPGTPGGDTRGKRYGRVKALFGEPTARAHNAYLHRDGKTPEVRKTERAEHVAKRFGLGNDTGTVKE